MTIEQSMYGGGKGNLKSYIQEAPVASTESPMAEKDQINTLADMGFLAMGTKKK
jgi:hypothetical protein